MGVVYCTGREQVPALWSHGPSMAIVSYTSSIPQRGIGKYVGIYIYIYVHVCIYSLN